MLQRIYFIIDSEYRPFLEARVNDVKFLLDTRAVPKSAYAIIKTCDSAARLQTQSGG
jgi:hypothetical protein